MANNRMLADNYFCSHRPIRHIPLSHTEGRTNALMFASRRGIHISLTSAPLRMRRD
jgi:hypothetical protein